jgi:hypothetical protein
MSLVDELARTACQWKIEPAGPGRVIVSLREGARGPLVTREFSTHREVTVENLLSTTLRRDLPLAPAYLAWRTSCGAIPARFAQGIEDWFSEAVHTGLRKLADTKQSVLTWNAIHHLAAGDRIKLWTAIGAVVEEAKAEAPAPTRLQVAQSLKERVCKALRNLRDELLENPGEPARKRSSSEEFALLVLETGCEMTSIEEWMSGWLGYLWAEEDIASPGVPPSAVRSRPVARRKPTIKPKAPKKRTGLKSRASGRARTATRQR